MPQIFTEFDGLTTHVYQVEIDGVNIAQCAEISGISIERQVIEHRATLPLGQEVIKKIPGPKKYGDITLKRAVTDNDELYKWAMEVMDGSVDAARRNGSIVEYDTNYGEVNRWNFTNGWPSKFEGASHKANANEVAVESVTITVEAIEKG
jgi:phage tail-like protein